MNNLNDAQLLAAAKILTDSLPHGWETIDSAIKEINEILIPENTLLAAVEKDIVIGWGGIIPQYDGNVYELHPLVVRADKRKSF